MLLSTRRRHGSLPVRVTPGGYELVRECGVETYPNAHNLLLSLYGGRFVGMSFDRYFHLGRYAYKTPERPRLQLMLRPALVVVSSTSVGIDLNSQSKLREIARLLQASCGKMIRGNGYEFDDILQEVCRGLLVRNQGAGAWDPVKSSFGTYVTMVCRCIFSNYHRHSQRLRSRETVGIRICTAEGITDTDASEVAVSGETSMASDRDMYECMTDLADHIDDRVDAYRQNAKLFQEVLVAKEALPLVFAGKRRGEIAKALALSSPTVGRALAYLRQATGDWMQSRGSFLYRR
jgi:DNA-directed RNA polymerase specialized sigma24 family protein